MTKLIILHFALFFSISVCGQTVTSLKINQNYKDIPLSKTESLSYDFELKKGGIYQFTILQQGIATYIQLSDSEGKQVFESDFPDDIDGYEKFEYQPKSTQTFHLSLKRFDNDQNTDSGMVSVFIKSLSESEILRREEIKKELEPENKKNVLTIDIDHFWEAFDNLSNCKSFADSVNSFQELYLDRATDGLIDFIRVRDFQAEKYVQLVARFPKFYRSLRKSTFEVKKTEQAIESVFSKFKEIYPNFKPFKVCFAMGIMNTGGTVSNNFVLIGTEIVTSSDKVDLSEFEDNEYRKIFEGTNELLPKIKSLVAHECVHTQQLYDVDSNAIKCELLRRVLKEGSADFIAELVSGNKKTNEYGNQNEDKIWADFKNELCNLNSDNWLYNASNVKNKPADLGYFIGYKIAEEYYNNAFNKKQAVSDIIEMNNPIRFLELSKYDQKIKK